MRKRHEVKVQRLTEARDGAGQRTETWETYFTTRCAVRHLTGREIDRTSGEHSRVTTEVTMWHAEQLKVLVPDHRLLIGDRAYNVLFVNNIGERNRKLLVRCEYDPAS